MKFLEMIGHAMRPLHSDASKLIECEPEVRDAPGTIVLSSPVFANGAKIPASHTVDGNGFFPELHWKNLPEGCQSLLLVIEDPDAPKSEPFVHAIVYNIPTNWSVLAKSVFTADGLSQDALAHGVGLGKNSAGQATYMAPAPPPGHGLHHYHFQLIALDAKLLFPGQPTLAEVKEAIAGRILGAGELIGTYER
jgi:Raf kinase inhibitor-like YbhB/YbcL family protein